MLYLLGGAARAGKSTIAHKFLAETGTPFFCLDYLMMGLTHGAPCMGIDPNTDDLQTASLLTPVIKAMAVAMIENGEHYLLEGVQLHPSLAAELLARFPGQVTACFLGYAEADVSTKSVAIRTFPGVNNDWLASASDPELTQTVTDFIQLSQRLRNACQQANLRYFEISADFTTTIKAVVDFFKTAPTQG